MRINLKPIKSKKKRERPKAWITKNRKAQTIEHANLTLEWISNLKDQSTEALNSLEPGKMWDEHRFNIAFFQSHANAIKNLIELVEEI